MPTSSKTQKKIIRIGGGWGGWEGGGFGNGNLFMGWKEGSMLTCLDCYVHKQYNLYY